MQQQAPIPNLTIVAEVSRTTAKWFLPWEIHLKEVSANPDERWIGLVLRYECTWTEAGAHRRARKMLQIERKKRERAQKPVEVRE